MEVDAAMVGKGVDGPNWQDRSGKRISEEERKKQQQEGQCFLCGRQGHMRRTCPKQRNGQNKNVQGGSARAAVTDEDWQEGRPDDDQTPKPPAYSKDNLVNSIKALDINARDELMDQIMDDQGF